MPRMALSGRLIRSRAPAVWKIFHLQIHNRQFRSPIRSDYPAGCLAVFSLLWPIESFGSREDEALSSRGQNARLPAGLLAWRSSRTLPSQSRPLGSPGRLILLSWNQVDVLQRRICPPSVSASAPSRAPASPPMLPPPGNTTTDLKNRPRIPEEETQK